APGGVAAPEGAQGRRPGGGPPGGHPPGLQRGSARRGGHAPLPRSLLGSSAGRLQGGGGRGEGLVTMAATKVTGAENSVMKELVVEAPQERAFRVFTERFDTWWPREHHIGKSPLKQAVLEGRQGGGWYELGEDGSRCEWGKVLVWDPPRRVVLT